MALIELIDLEYLGQPGAIGAYLIRAPEGPVLIETGPGSCHDALVKGVRALGYQPGDVSNIFVTHIHLDHSGGAGWWAQQGATIHVHPFGVRHLVDPSRLLASAGRIYGDAMDRLFGPMLPAPAENIREVTDGETIDCCGLPIRIIETPGHARHHHAYAMEADGQRICFTGDIAAMIGPADGDGIPPILIPTPPPELDVEAWHESINRIESENFDALYLTHIGRVDDPPALLAGVHSLLDEHKMFVKSALDRGGDEPALQSAYRSWMRDRALADGLPATHLNAFVTQNLTGMNVTGLMRYWNGVLSA